MLFRSEWTPPGGVIDHGETVTQGISREVHEETGLHVPKWDERHYLVTVTAPDMGWEMTVESWFTTVAHGTISLNDPDRIVEQVMWVDLVDVEALLADSPPWVRVPLTAWVMQGLQPMPTYSFHVYGADRTTARIEQRAP